MGKLAANEMKANLYKALLKVNVSPFTTYTAVLEEKFMTIQQAIRELARDYSNRQQAMRIQQTLETLYQGIGGHYYYGDGAWAYVQERTGVNLKDILVQIANERVPNDAQA
mgnify:CR=1 FL=1